MAKQKAAAPKEEAKKEPTPKKAKAKRIANRNVYIRGCGHIYKGDEFPEGIEVNSKYVA